MLWLIVPVAIGAVAGALLGYWGQCTSGSCPLTATWWRGALYGGSLGLVFGMLSERRAEVGGTGSRSAAVREITEGEFESAVMQADKPVLVDFYAPWCGPCKALAPVIDGIADEFEGRIDVVKVNVDKAPNLAARYNVRGIPTLMVFDEGKGRDTIVGMVSAGALRERLQPFARGSAAGSERGPAESGSNGSQ
jgi:thioredoxin 1